MTNNIFKNNLPYNILIIETIKYKKQIKNNFDKLILKNNLHNPFRQFYHLPPTKNIYKYSKYLYPSGINSCKNDSLKCKPYNDIRIYKN